MSQTRKMLITAGPTHESIDAVRYIANRSSGRLGLWLAEAANAAGWDTTLLLGPTNRMSADEGIRTAWFESTADLAALLDEHFPLCDALVMAAAVADYRPARVNDRKLPRSERKLILELEPTPDLVARCTARKRPGQMVIGFALEEPGLLDRRAREKLTRKGLDAIVANPLATMGADNIRAMVLTAEGETITPAACGGAPHAQSGMSKREFADWLVGWIGTRL